MINYATTTIFDGDFSIASIKYAEFDGTVSEAASDDRHQIEAGKTALPVHPHVLRRRGRSQDVLPELKQSPCLVLVSDSREYDSRFT